MNSVLGCLRPGNRNPELSVTAASGLPKMGASTKRAPCCACNAASFFDVSGSTVLIEIWTLPGPKALQETRTRDDAFQGRIVPHQGCAEFPLRSRRSAARGQPARPGRPETPLLLAGAVVHAKWIPGTQEIRRYWQTQVAKTDKSHRFIHVRHLLSNMTFTSCFGEKTY